ncbi:signal peptidase II [Bifidobacterium tsurumiense]|uniref:Lipoprotein signal peptidase n=1 Tax=Bifidobacterium tsurumiense TaxID=356829 RepID=A0A087EJW0_9BIFI|nr:signal peptidase II [Bifidobacterium tsurumiense]KFJ08061.1 lipoprotein signal peptidase [Bifidobacterium tsurumiense]MDY4677551.1 signal peptidase II [Bifidobacterium tsurumiense]MSS12991.1 signal peptidase II [Bifidobacterium tsurumiense]
MSKETTVSRGRSHIRAAVFGCIATTALVLDQVSKYWALNTLSHGRTIPVLKGLLSLTLVRNPGATLGLGSSMTWLITVLAMVACVAILVLAYKTISMRWTSALALAFAGALGNLIDRIVYADGVLNGKVVDFLDYGWSVGNVADVFLMIAGVAIVILIISAEPFSKAELERQTTQDAHEPAEDERAFHLSEDSNGVLYNEDSIKLVKSAGEEHDGSSNSSQAGAR